MISRSFFLPRIAEAEMFRESLLDAKKFLQIVEKYNDKQR